MKRKSNADKIAERRAKRRTNIEKDIKQTNNVNNIPVYGNSNLRKEVNTRKTKVSRTSKLSKSKNRRKKTSKKPFKNYIIVLIIALLILLISIISSNRKEDVSKFFYLNNQKIFTKVPIKVVLAKNSTAKVAVLSLEDIKENFDQNIRFNDESREIITTGKTHVSKIILNDYAINTNGTDSVINVSAFEEEGKIYLPLNDLSSVYGIEVFITEGNKVIVDEFHKEKKVVRVFANTKLKKSKFFLSKTLTKLSELEDYVLVEETKNKLKVRTLDGTYGYIPSKKSKSIIEMRSDYIEEEGKQYNIIRNYKNPEDNFDKIEIKADENNASIIEIFKTNTKSKTINLTEKYSKDGSSYKIFREKLSSNNIESIAELNLEKYKLDTYLETFEKRGKFIQELLKITNKHNVQGIELLIDDTSNLDLYENFVEELKPRLKERGLKLFIQSDKIKSERIKGIIDYES